MNPVASRIDDEVESSRDHVGESDGRATSTDRLLVLDAHKNASVVFSRALAEADVDVEITIGGWSRLSPGMLSRHTDRRFLHSSPYQHPEQFVSELRAHLRTNSYLAVVPMSDLSHVLLSKNKRRLEETGTAVGTETWETFVSANNKKALAGLLEDLSVPSPQTSAPESVDDVAGMKDEFSYPVVIKPQFTTVETTERTFTEARITEENYVDRPDDLVSGYRSLLEKYPYLAEDLPIVQEVVPGDVVATCGVADDGDFVQYFQEERLRMFPVDGGSSALRQGIYEPQMAAYTREIVAALEWTGPIYVEFVRSPDGTYKVLEVNGRYWGSVGCAICGGVNVPLLHLRQLKGEDLPSDQGYRLGRQQRRLFYTDIKWLIAQLEDGNTDALVPFLKSFFDAEDDLLVLDDPLPVAGAILWALQEILQSKGPTDPLMYELPESTAGVLELLGRAAR